MSLGVMVRSGLWVEGRYYARLCRVRVISGKILFFGRGFRSFCLFL